MRKNSRERIKLRRMVALQNRQSQLEKWKKAKVGDDLTQEKKTQKILKAEDEIKILKARL